MFNTKNDNALGSTARYRGIAPYCQSAVSEQASSHILYEPPILKSVAFDSSERCCSQRTVGNNSLNTLGVCPVPKNRVGFFTMNQEKNPIGFLFSKNTLRVFQYPKINFVYKKQLDVFYLILCCTTKNHCRFFVTTS